MSNKTKKLIKLFVTLLITLTLLSACSDDKDKKAKDETKTTSTKSIENSESDESSDSSGSEDELGLCDIATEETIKTALGSAASTLDGPNSTGVQSLGDGDKGTTCVYPFEQDGDVSNSFYMDLAQYSQESFDLIKDFTGTSGEDVSGVGDSAKFEASDSYTGGKEFTITAIQGTNVYLFVIALPEGSSLFDETSAKTALTTIAQSASLN